MGRELESWEKRFFLGDSPHADAYRFLVSATLLGHTNRKELRCINLELVLAAKQPSLL
jgi:hypothetical protein